MTFPAAVLDRLRRFHAADRADADLLRDYAERRDEDAFRALLDRHGPLLLRLCFWQGLTQDEAARRLGCSPGAVKGRLERGRARLAERLTKRGIAPAVLLAAPLATAAVPGDLLAKAARLPAGPVLPAIAA